MLGAVIAGCVVSKGALFDTESAVTPIPAGEYQRVKYVVGNWVSADTGVLKLVGSSYVWTTRAPADGPEMETKFTLHQIGGGLFVAMSEVTDDKKRYDHGYDLIAQHEGGFFQYGAHCGSVKYLRLPIADQPKVDGDFCLYATREALIDSIRTLAERNFPQHDYRLKRFQEERR
jgi:hypothetical protein